MLVNPSILLLRLKSIGDILFTLPAVHFIHESFPASPITFLVSKEFSELLKGFLPVKRLIPLDRESFRGGNPFVIARTAYRLYRELRVERFGLTVDFQGYGETAFLSWMSQAPQRWGSVYRRSRVWAYTHGVIRDDRLHPIDWNLELLRQCGLRNGNVQNQFHLPDNELENAKRLLIDQGCAPEMPTVMLQPFSSSQHKDWPLQNYIRIAQVYRDRGIQVLFSGGPADREALGPAKECGFPVTAGVPLLTTAGILKMSSIVVGGDTGVLHLATALGQRVVMLMGEMHKGSAVPYGHKDWVVQPPPSHKAIADIKFERVLAACDAALVEQNASKP